MTTSEQVSRKEGVANALPWTCLIMRLVRLAFVTTDDPFFRELAMFALGLRIALVYVVDW
jgi:hypothetical protein